jgi:hypothetical protein
VQQARTRSLLRIAGAAATSAFALCLIGTGSAAAPDPGTNLAPLVSHRAKPKPAAPAGGLEVAVPRVPSEHALKGLCVAYLAGARSGTEIGILVGATGGTHDATSAWCHNYLDYLHRTLR